MKINVKYNPIKEEVFVRGLYGPKTINNMLKKINNEINNINNDLKKVVM